MKSMRLFAGLLALFGVATACNAAAADPRPDFEDVAYAPAQPAGSVGHLLDIYLPKSAEKPSPVVIWTSGSAWRGDAGRTRGEWLVSQLLPRGYAVVGVSIRSSSQAQFPAQLHDIKAAIRFLRVNAKRYGLDTDHIAIIGTSSGAWAASMAAVTGGRADLEGDVGVSGASSAVSAAIAFWPPTNFVTMDAWAVKPCKQIEYRGAPGFCHDDADSPESSLVGCAIQSCPDRVRAASPLAYVSPRSPPILIVHGQSDALVNHNQGESLYQAYNKACADAVFYSVPKLGHGQFPEVLTDAKLVEGASRRSTSSAGCAVELPQPATLDGNVVFQFLAAHLKR